MRRRDIRGGGRLLFGGLLMILPPSSVPDLLPASHFCSGGLLRGLLPHLLRGAAAGHCAARGVLCWCRAPRLGIRGGGASSGDGVMQDRMEDQPEMEEQLESDEDESGEMVPNPVKKVVGDMLERLDAGEELGPEDLPDDVRKDFYLALRDGRAFNASAPLVVWWTLPPFLAAPAGQSGEGWWARDGTRLAEEELVWNGAREEGFFWAQVGSQTPMARGRST